MNFKKNLKNLMDKANIKNIELAKILGLNKSTITLYLNGQRMPNYETLEKLKDYFSCSYDDLLK